MPDHPRFRVVCHCKQHGCPYRGHRKPSSKDVDYSSLGIWAIWYGLGVTFFIISALVEMPRWLFWCGYGLFILGAFVLLFPTRQKWLWFHTAEHDVHHADVTEEL